MIKKIRVIVVDDSATMRALITHALSSDPQIEVVAGASDALEARTAIRELDPDVVTLDVEMPKMNGIDFLEKIMQLRPMPVIMVSNLTQAGAQATIRALEIGAVDCIAKPAPGQEYNGFDALPEVVRQAARTRLRRLTRTPAAPLTKGESPYRPDGKLIAVGSSTGGVEALLTMLQHFPANCAPTLVTQHMPPGFTRSFADRLDRHCKPRVREASDGDTVEPGNIYIAPGGKLHLEVSGRGSGTMRCRLVDAPAVNGHRPSVDVLFQSVARVAGPQAVGAILTGMGNDGAVGLLEIRNAGGRTFGQNEATSLVYGMPKVAFSIGAVEQQLPLARIADAVLTASNRVKEGVVS